MKIISSQFSPQQLKREWQAVINFKKREQILHKKMYLKMYHLKGYELADYFFKIEREKFEILKKIEAFKRISKLKDYDYDVYRYITTDISTTDFSEKYRTLCRKLNRVFKVYKWILSRL